MSRRKPKDWRSFSIGRLPNSPITRSEGNLCAISAHHSSARPGGPRLTACSGGTWEPAVGSGLFRLRALRRHHSAAALV